MKVFINLNPVIDTDPEKELKKGGGVKDTFSLKRRRGSNPKMVLNNIGVCLCV